MLIVIVFNLILRVGTALRYMYWYFKRVIEHYINKGSHVFLCFIDLC